jgi:ribosome-associated heat shock protein Hsp15
LSISAKKLERQRIDKWLWHARMVRTRTTAGFVRVNGKRMTSASHRLRVHFTAI